MVVGPHPPATLRLCLSLAMAGPVSPQPPPRPPRAGWMATTPSPCTDMCWPAKVRCSIPTHAMPCHRLVVSLHPVALVPIPVPVPVPVMVAGRRSLKASVRFAMPSASDDAEEQLGLGLGPGASLCVCLCVSCKTCSFALLSAVSLRGAALSGALLQRQPDLVAGAASAAATAVRGRGRGGAGLLGAHDRRLSLRVSAAQQVAAPRPAL